MKLLKRFLFLCLFFFSLPDVVPYALAQKHVVYKTIDSIVLSMDIYYPPKMVAGKTYPVIIFFFGGGWIQGDKVQFEHHAKYFTERGMISVLADYRVQLRNNTTPFEALKDAKSAIRYLRSNAARFHIDQDRIVASGGSAGGHLAAAAACCEKYNDDQDDLTVSAKPNAMVLFNPVIDNGPGGYGFDRIGEEYRFFSPLHNLHRGMPPTIFFLGTNDLLIPVETARYYKMLMEKIGSRCDLHVYEGQIHGFFNFKKLEYYKKTVLLADEFLVSIGYLSGHPAIDGESGNDTSNQKK
ncbi:MAG: alpha/beta hydrolase [Prolixibacteraceae bacterium]|jgi:acetyl esterase/lipase|nr:alpha/beta hydrolase [Prolixibacteraceae bacterium]